MKSVGPMLSSNPAARAGSFAAAQQQLRLGASFEGGLLRATRMPESKRRTSGAEANLGLDRGAVLGASSFRELLRSSLIGGGTRCRVITQHVVIKTPHGNVTLPTAGVKMLQFRRSLFSLQVVATTLDGGTYRGKLLTKRLHVRYKDAVGSPVSEVNCRKLDGIYAHPLDAPIPSMLEGLVQALDEEEQTP